MIAPMHSSGATLAITLILLFVVTLLGVGSMQVIHLQEKMSANLQDKELSFHAAESALAAGEAWVMSLSHHPGEEISCQAYPCVQEVYKDLNYTTQTSNWWQANSAVYPTQLHNIASQPRYFVELLQFVPDSPTLGDSSMKSTGVYYYQITARGTGASDHSVSILQSTMGRRY